MQSLTLFGLGDGHPEGFTEYLKNDFTLSSLNFVILRQLYKSSFEIKNFHIDHSLLPWLPIIEGLLG